ncbi:MAG: beta-lactamase family protein [Acidobacteria bacterium]|nr:beta-lactamase family protein [Acidobacteriota bacterium]MBI3428218.1 beta-lactamase family protein [Acidobacteriota bacterium]
MRRSIFLRGLLATVPAAYVTRAQAAARPAQTLTEKFEATRQSFNLPALAGVTVTTKAVGEVVYTGFRRAGSTVQITGNDKWHLGSDTKALTATLMAMLVEARKLKWETTLGEVFPELAKTMTPDLARVNLLHLLSHRAGLPPNVAWFTYGKRGVTYPEQRLAVLNDLLDKPLKAKPGSQYEYSNLGYTIAGAVAEKVTGQAWETLMQERIFRPLGMKSAGFGGLGKEGELDQPWPHGQNGKPMPKNGPAVDNPEVMGPAGTVHCSLSDWALFIADQLRGARGQGQLLRPESYQRLQTPPFEGEYALGWLVVERAWAKGKALTHAGSNTMNFAVAWLAPARETAFLVCTNMGGENATKGADEAVGHLLKAQFPSS